MNINDVIAWSRGDKSHCCHCRREIIYHTGQGLPWWEHDNGKVFCGMPYGNDKGATPEEVVSNFTERANRMIDRLAISPDATEWWEACPDDGGEPLPCTHLIHRGDWYEPRQRPWEGLRWPDAPPEEVAVSNDEDVRVPVREYCSTYCEHNADGKVCGCQPCVFLRTEVSFIHASGCRHAAPAVAVSNEEWETSADSFGVDTTYPQGKDDWLPHTCNPEEIPAAGCRGCRQRSDLDLRPISKRTRQAQLDREEFERGPQFAAFGVVGNDPVVPQIWLAACSWCGSLVLASTIREQSLTTAVHADWHRRNKTR